MMRDQIIATARSYLGVPFTHQGSSRSAGVDCWGLFCCVCRDLQLFPPGYEPPFDYDSSPPSERLVQELMLLCGEPKKEKQNGDLLVFRIRRTPQHLGIFVEPTNTVIHAYTGPDVVSESPLEDWESRILLTFNFPSVGGLCG